MFGKEEKASGQFEEVGNLPLGKGLRHHPHRGGCQSVLSKCIASLPCDLSEAVKFEFTASSNICLVKTWLAVIEEKRENLKFFGIKYVMKYILCNG